MMLKNNIIHIKKIQNIIITIMLISILFSPLISTVNAEQNPPSDFNAKPFSRFGIELSWTNNEENNTYIEWSTSKPWSLGEGTLLYNSTNTNYNHINLPPGTHFFYQAWSYNETDNSYSTTYQEADATTYPNQLPDQKNNYPFDNSVDISITQPTVSILLEDVEGDPISWTIQGQYLINNGLNDDSNGTKTANLLIPLPFNTEIVWYVNATDGFGWTNETYNFITRNKYVPNPPTSFTTTTYNRTQIDLNWTPGDNADTTYIEWNTIETWTIGQGTLLYNNTGSTTSHKNLNFNKQYFYQAWSWNNTDKTWSTTSRSSNATTNPNNAPSITGESPADGSTGQNPLPILSVTVNDLDKDLLDVFWYSNSSGSWLLFGTNLDVDTNSGPVTLSKTNTNFSSYSTKYWWSIHCFDGTDWLNTTYSFTIRNQFVPNPPNNFIASTFNSSQINLLWVKGNISDYTRIQRKTGSYPTSITDGTNVYNGTGTQYENHGLNEGVTYFYRAWGYNITDNTWSTYASAYNTTNSKTTVSNPVPESGSIGINILPQLGITINDINEDLMTIQWYSNSSGSWQIFGTNNTVINGTYHQTNANFSDYGKTYWWYVIVNDGKDITLSNTFYFTVNNKPVISNPIPANGSTNINPIPQLSITIDDIDDDLFTIKWYSNSSGTWNIFGSNTNVADGTYNQINTNFSEYNKTYWWYATVDDGTDTNISGIYHFTIRAQYIPSPPSPFTAIKFNRTQINLSWTPGNKADTTFIEWNTIETWVKGQGTLLYNGSEINISHKGLNYNTKYYYKAWSWNNTDKIWSTTSSNSNATTDPNIAPTISGEIPSNDSINIFSNPTLQVTVDDFEHDLLDVYWYSNTSGSWQLFGTNLDIDTTGGSVTISKINANFSSYSTKYWWSVRCFDGTNWTNKTYDFTRSSNYPPTISNPNPANGSTNLNPTPICNITVTDVNEDTMTVYFYENTTRISGTLNYQIYYDVDDAYNYKNVPKNDENSIILNFASDYKTMGGLRFRNIQIPQGATIISANLYTRINYGYPYYGNDADCTIYGDDVDTSGFIEGGQSLTDRTLTTANVLWQQENLDNSWVESPDISNIIQEIINRPGWSNGNNVTIITNGTLSDNSLVIYDYQYGDHTRAAKLNITYITDITIWQLKQTNTNVVPGSNIIWNKFQNATKFNTTYWWSVNATDGLKWTNNTYHFTTREQYIPNQPTTFTAASINSNKINLAWTKGNKADYTRIQRKTDIYPTSISDGTNVYNNTGTTYDDIGITEGKTYYYSAWSYNVSDSAWSLSYISAYNITNNKPKISNPVPENGSSGASLTSQMNITVNDTNGDLMTIQWYSNSSGSWQIFGTNNTVINGTYHQTNANFSEYGKTYWWYVTVNDGKDTNTSNTFYFKINSKPTISNPWPTNGSIGVRLTPQMNITIVDLEGDKMILQWYSNSSGGWEVFKTNNNVNNGTYYYTNTNFSNYNTTYWWYVAVNDGKSTNSSPIFQFTTNNKPRISSPYPENESTGIIIKPYMNITIDDADADTMTVQWYSNSSGTWQIFGTNNSVTNGTYHQINTNFKKYNTAYWWYISVNDTKDTIISDKFKFTTMLNSIPLVYGAGPINNSENIKTVPILNITVDDPNKDLLDVYWYSNTSGSWILFATNNSIDPKNNPVNISQTNSNFTKYITKYWWSVRCFDGTDWVNNTYCFTTMQNTIPTVSNEKPVNGSINISARPLLNVEVYDSNQDKLDVYWYSNSSESWSLFGKNLSINISNNPINITQINSNLSKYNTTYWWSVNVTDGTDWVNKTYYFTTKENIAPIVSNPIPVDGVTGLCIPPVKFSINISDTDGDVTDITLKTNASGTWITFNTSTNNVNGSYSFTNTGWVSQYGTKYWWSANVTDGTTWVNKTFNFTTNFKPTISGAIPSNSSNNLNPQPICNVTVSDKDGDTSDVYIYENATTIYSSFNSKIIDDADDAYYLGGMQNSDSQVKLNDQGTAQLFAGLRFRNVEIPQGATITNATLNVRVFGSNFDDPDITIYGHNTDNSPEIEGSIGGDELINRVLTTSNVQWIDLGIGSDWRRSPDIANIIQEIVNRPGWKYDNNITILTKDTQNAKIFSIADCSVDSNLSAELNITFNYTPWVLQQTNYSVANNSKVIWNKYSNATLFNKKYWWSVHVNDGCSWTNETYIFTTRNAYIPSPPLGFSAFTNERTRINLSWVNNENNTYIEWNTIPSWSPGEGTFLINTNSTSNYSHSGLETGTKYYYQAWGCNTTDQVFSQTYLSANATTYGNSKPAFTNEKPENNSINVDIKYSQVSIDITDQNGDTLNWTIQGKYIINNSSNNDINGTKTATLVAPLPFNTNIIWYVNATDGFSITNKTYNFTTRAQYIPTAPIGFTAKTYNRTQINLSWIDTDDNIYIEYNTTESWERGQGILLENSSINNSYAHTCLNHTTKYFYKAWQYNQTDNVFSISNISLNATTETNYAPKYSSPTPINGTLGHNFTIIWSIIINDDNSDTFNWRIECNNSQYNLSSNDINGTKQLELSGLARYTKYTIWVNATDGFTWTREWFTFTTKSGYEPPNPTNFSASAFNRTQINLSWNNDGNNCTYIEWSYSKNWALGNGNKLENSSINTSFVHTGLNHGTQYFYQAWSYNKTLNVYSNYVEANATTYSNNKPVLGTPSPSNGAINQPLALTWSISITDPDNDYINWTIQCSNYQSNYLNKDINGIKQLQLVNLNYNTFYKIWVNATDGYEWNNATYSFTTITENDETPTLPPYYPPTTPTTDIIPPTTPTNVRCISSENDDTTYFTWDASTDAAGIRSYYVKIDNQNEISVGNKLYWTATTTIEDGNHTFYVRAEDLNLNKGSYGSCVFTIGTSSNGKRPVAVAGGPYYGLTYKPIQFDGSNSYDTDGVIVSGLWDFGNGSTVKGAKPTYTFNESGIFNVTLTVTDDDGLTDNDTTIVTVLLDSDKDGWSDELEKSYGTNASDSNDEPLDTDGDGTPDDPSPDRKYSGDIDDDNDGLRDDYEKDLGSDPKNNFDVISFKINNYPYYLVDINKDGKKDIFFNDNDQTNTALGYKDNKYLIDTNGDGIWDITYDLASGEVTSYNEDLSNVQSTLNPWVIPVLITIAIVSIIILIVAYLFKIGYFFIEYIPKEQTTKKKSKKNNK